MSVLYVRRIDPTKLPALNMETLEDTDNITKNLVREIYRECKTKNVIEDENFCVFYVKLLMLDPKWGISPESTLNRENVANLVNFCVEKLVIGNDPHIITLKSQYYFMWVTENRDAKVILQRYDLVQKIKGLKLDILNFQLKEYDKMSEQKLFKKIVIYITLMSGLGNPKENTVMKEATAALQSVFDDKDIQKFVTLSEYEKEEQLHFVQDLVMGIRIYNLKSGKTSSGIIDLPNALDGATEIAILELENELLKVMEKVNVLTTAITNSYELLRDGSKNYVLHLLHENNFDSDNEITKLVTYRQYEILIRKLLLYVESIRKKKNILCEEKLNSLYKELIEIIKYKVAIPITQVYPLFTKLAEYSYQIQDETITLSKYDKLFLDLHHLVKKIEFNLPMLMKVIGSNPILTDAMRLELTMGIKIEPLQNFQCQLLKVEDINIYRRPLEYHGFCPFYLAETNGGLVPGNPNMGILKWKQKYYAFSTPQAAHAFGIQPEKYIYSILDTCRQRPELIYFLNLLTDLTNVRKVPILFEKPMKVVIVNNVEVQTELHPIPRHIDPNYRWNVWDLYRDAIKMANISEGLTRSTQTNISHFRAPVRIQTTEQRDKLLQTKRDNYTNVPTLSNFIFGLRGRKDDAQHIVELTRPVDE